MKKFLIAAMMVMGSVSLVISEAEARRMGGGGSIGKQYSRPAPSQPAQQQAAPSQPGQTATAPRQNPAAAAPAAAARPSLMRNIFGGLLLGLGLGALLSYLGIGGTLASIIGTILTFALIALAVMFLFRLFARKNGNTAQPAYAGAYAKSSTPEIGSGLNQPARPAALQGDTMPASSAGAVDVPADFDTAAFLRNAKTYFIRLQAAWDRADVNDIREFTTPELFAELRMQLQERGASANFTDVVSLDAELLGIETAGNDYLASVKFSGMIREEENAAAEPFAEMWNLTKPITGQGGWVLAGIQQL